MAAWRLCEWWDGLVACLSVGSVMGVETLYTLDVGYGTGLSVVLRVW